MASRVSAPVRRGSSRPTALRSDKYAACRIVDSVVTDDVATWVEHLAHDQRHQPTEHDVADHDDDEIGARAASPGRGDPARSACRGSPHRAAPPITCQTSSDVHRGRASTASGTSHNAYCGESILFSMMKPATSRNAIWPTRGRRGASAHQYADTRDEQHHGQRSDTFSLDGAAPHCAARTDRRARSRCRRTRAAATARRCPSQRRGSVTATGTTAIRAADAPTAHTLGKDERLSYSAAGVWYDSAIAGR